MKKSLRWKVTQRDAPVHIGILTVRQHEAAHPESGQRRRFTVIETSDWVNVVALTPDDQVVFVRQFRHGLERVTLEIPGGAIDPGETPRRAAIRELKEETGYVGRRIRKLGVVEPNPAIQANRCHLFLALDVEHRFEAQPDPGEVLEVERHPLGEVPELLRDGRVNHALVAAAFLHLHLAAGGWGRPRERGR